VIGPSIAFRYDLPSPYRYLSAMRIEMLATIDWKQALDWAIDWAIDWAVALGGAAGGVSPEPARV